MESVPACFPVGPVPQHMPQTVAARLPLVVGVAVAVAPVLAKPSALLFGRAGEPEDVILPDHHLFDGVDPTAGDDAVQAAFEENVAAGH